MELHIIFTLTALLFAVSFLYSSVGHGGASGYIALMALMGMAPIVIRPAALSLNVIVAGFATYRFIKAGYLDWRNVVPLVVVSVPLAFLGGTVLLPSEIYRPLLGCLLVFSAVYLVWRTTNSENTESISKGKIPILAGILSGGCIGFLSGLTGFGGGVLLSPLLLIMTWTSARQTAGFSAVFILVNSIAGLSGNLISLQNIPPALPMWAFTIFLGSWIGTTLGLRLLPVKMLIWLLAAAIFISGLKFVFL